MEYSTVLGVSGCPSRRTPAAAVRSKPSYSALGKSAPYNTVPEKNH